MNSLGQLERTWPLILAAVIVVALWILLWRSRRQGSFTRSLAACVLRSLAVLCVGLFLCFWKPAGGPRLTPEIAPQFVEVISLHQGLPSDPDEIGSQLANSQYDAAWRSIQAEYRELPLPVVMLDKAISDDPTRQLLEVVGWNTPNTPTRVLFFTDGLVDGREIERIAPTYPLPVDVVLLPAFAPGEIAITNLEAPMLATPGSEVEIRITTFAPLSKTPPVAAKLRVTLDEEEMVQNVGAMTSVATFKTVMPERPLDIVAEIEGVEEIQKDGIIANNKRRWRIYPRSGTKILLVGREASEQSSAVRQMLAGDNRTFVTYSRLNDTPPNFYADFGLAVMDAAATRELGRNEVEQLSAAVNQGMGLVVLADPSWEEKPQHLANHPLAALLPVTPAKEAELPPPKTLALVLVIDRSKSMLEGRRIELARRAAIDVVGRLAESDSLGVIAFSNEAEWIVPLAKVVDRQKVNRQIEGLEAVGLTNMLPAMQDGLFALAATEADRRVMFLLTDGIPVPGEYDEVARQLKAAGIGLVTVSLGDGADRQLLEQLAAEADGRAFHVAEATELPELLAREAAAATTQEETRSFQPFAVSTDGPLAGDALPAVEGLVATQLKAGSRVQLIADQGEPVVADWPQGKGKVLFIASPFFETAGKDLRADERVGQWFRQESERMTRRSQDDWKLSLHKQENGFSTQYHLLLDILAADGSWHSSAEPKVTFTSGNERSTRTLDLIAPGRFELVLDEEDLSQADDGNLSENLTGRIEWQTASGDQSGAKRVTEFALFPSPHSLLLPNPAAEATRFAELQALAEATGGTFDATPEELAALIETTQAEAQVTSLGNNASPFWLLAVAICLVLADFATRYSLT